MDIEKLTKQQIVLVTLLVSFVTSIATGIVTVALMDQAPPGVTQTINRVVERTIEKVVTPPEGGNAAAVVTKETVIVREDDKITEAIEKNKDSVVRIYTATRDPDDSIFVGLGTVVSKDGLIATGDIFADVQGRYRIFLSNNESYQVSVLKRPKGNKVYFLKVIQESTIPVSFKPITFADSSKLKLGQSIITLGGISQNSVSTGIISSLVNDTKATSTNAFVGLTTNNSNDTLPGGPLLNLDGEVIGIRIGMDLSDQYNFFPSNLVKTEVATY